MPNRIDRSQIVRKLRNLLTGEVLADARARRRYARDQSIFQIDPLAVVLPADRQDLGKLMRFASEAGLPVTPRGGGSGTAGGALGAGLVVVLPRTPYWQKIDDFSIRQGRPHISTTAGIFHNDLQGYLKKEGYLLPADVTSAAISRVGGNVATRASGPHALKWGAIDRFLENLEFITVDGELIDTADPRTIPAAIRDRLGQVEQRLLADRRACRILSDRRGMKTSSGYNLAAFLEDLDSGQLLTQLMAGNNGTLGFITGVTLRGERLTAKQAVMLLAFDSLVEAVRAVTVIRQLGVEAIEIMDRRTVRLVGKKTGKLKNFSSDAHLLLVECAGEDSEERIVRIGATVRAEGLRTMAPPAIATDAERIAELWEVRRRILPLLSRPGPHLAAPAIVNDIGVAPARLADCILELQRIFRRQDVEALIYGHAGSGNLHVRPLFDMALPDPAGRLQRLADAVYTIVLDLGGTVAGEHGTGRLKAPYLRREWGASLYGYMREIKEILDPHGILNPGVMFSDAPITEHLRPEFRGQSSKGRGRKTKRR